MIQPFVNKFIEATDAVKAHLKANRPGSYDDLVTRLVTLLQDDSQEWNTPDPARITVIDHGDYQGTKLFVIGACGYQPSNYWSIFVHYGSCSGCDTFEANRDLTDWEAEASADAEVDGNWTMMLHMVQSMRPLECEAQIAA